MIRKEQSRLLRTHISPVVISNRRSERGTGIMQYPSSVLERKSKLFDPNRSLEQGCKDEKRVDDMWENVMSAVPLA